jgi:hypothetical protein
MGAYVDGTKRNSKQINYFFRHTFQLISRYDSLQYIFSCPHSQWPPRALD